MGTTAIFRIIAAIGAPFFGYLAINLMGRAFTMEDAWSVGVFLFGVLVMLLALSCVAIAFHKFKETK